MTDLSERTPPATPDHRLTVTIGSPLGAEPAYPWGDVTNGGVMGGLTKRELFAAMAMQGMNSMAGMEMMPADRIAEWAVEQADALLKELAK